MQSCEARTLLKWGFACFQLFFKSARQASQTVQLKKLQEKLRQERLAQVEANLQHSEKRAMCCEERLSTSEETRRREKARLCKLELDNRHMSEWRRNYEARCPVATRKMAIAILSATYKGFRQGVGTMVFTVWALFAARIKAARKWKTSPRETSSTEAPSLESHRMVSCCDATSDIQVEDILATWRTSEIKAHSCRDAVSDVNSIRSFEADSLQGQGDILTGKSISGCIWVDDESTEQLSEAMANMRAWKQQRQASPRLSLDPVGVNGYACSNTCQNSANFIATHDLVQMDTHAARLVDCNVVVLATGSAECRVESVEPVH
jgi:hypothetical protein